MNYGSCSVIFIDSFPTNVDQYNRRLSGSMGEPSGFHFGYLSYIPPWSCIGNGKIAANNSHGRNSEGSDAH